MEVSMSNEEYMRLKLEVLKLVHKPGISKPIDNIEYAKEYMTYLIEEYQPPSATATKKQVGKNNF